MEEKEKILELYENYIDDIYSDAIKNSEYSDMIKELELDLEKTLTEDQKIKQDEINKYYQKRNEEIYKNIWTSAYSLATKLIIEGLNN